MTFRPTDRDAEDGVVARMGAAKQSAARAATDFRGTWWTGALA